MPQDRRTDKDWHAPASPRPRYMETPVEERIALRRGEITALAIGLVAALMPAGLSAQDAVRLTLSEAIEHAWSHQPTVAIAEEGVRSAQAQVTSARAGFLPNVSVSGTYTYAGVLPKQVLDFGEDGLPFPLPGDTNEADHPTDGTNGGEEGPLEIEFGTRHDVRVIGQVQQPLFTWGKVLNGYRQAQRGFAAAQHHLEFTRQQTALDVTEAFYGVVVTQEAVGVAESASEQSDRRLSIAQTRVDAGAATQLDLLQAKVGLANARTQVIRAANGLQLARQNLVRALGLEARTAVEVEGELLRADFDGDLEELIEAALEHREDRKELLAQEEAARSLVRIARAGNKPNASVSGTAMWNDTEKKEDQTTWSVQVGVQIPLFDGFATRAQVRQAEARQRQVAEGVEALDSGIVLQVEQAYLGFTAANAVLEAQDEALTQVDEALRIANLSFENGIITSVELSDAELARTQTALGHLQAVHESVVALARLEQAVGMPLR